MSLLASLPLRSHGFQRASTAAARVAQNSCTTKVSRSSTLPPILCIRCRQHQKQRSSFHRLSKRPVLGLDWSSTLLFSAETSRSYCTDSTTGQDQPPTYTSSLMIRSPESMEQLGQLLARGAEAGDVILLIGDLGTGKTCFSRGFIRECAEDPDLLVTSPSYLLDNTYEATDGTMVHHMDLYRLSGADDLHVLNIPEILSTSVCLVEWPDRLQHLTPSVRLEVRISATSGDCRFVELVGHGEWWQEAVSGAGAAFADANT
ncbi:hypothetical protein JKP88DRAFT_236223 [Tribonema minus]|uniref:tRNA threonylcarbamoyladenosine biosynthesis protein TsaE n=1 Tax=Tribonema minus TaxID=303371 RepID=A0A835Z1V9_9STRA|nr:hypothetical protein JKP88DRAFT_236223 [Tribonema minus]